MNSFRADELIFTLGELRPFSIVLKDDVQRIKSYKILKAVERFDESNFIPFLLILDAEIKNGLSAYPPLIRVVQNHLIDLVFLLFSTRWLTKILYSQSGRMNILRLGPPSTPWLAETLVDSIVPQDGSIQRLHAAVYSEGRAECLELTPRINNSLKQDLFEQLHCVLDVPDILRLIIWLVYHDEYFRTMVFIDSAILNIPGGNDINVITANSLSPLDIKVFLLSLALWFFPTRSISLPLLLMLSSEQCKAWTAIRQYIKGKRDPNVVYRVTRVVETVRLRRNGYNLRVLYAVFIHLEKMDLIWADFCHPITLRRSTEELFPVTSCSDQCLLSVDEEDTILEHSTQSMGDCSFFSLDASHDAMSTVSQCNSFESARASPFISKNSNENREGNSATPTNRSNDALKLSKSVSDSAVLSDSRSENIPANMEGTPSFIIDEDTIYDSFLLELSEKQLEYSRKVFQLKQSEELRETVLERELTRLKEDMRHMQQNYERRLRMMQTGKQQGTEDRGKSLSATLSYSDPCNLIKQRQHDTIAELEQQVSTLARNEPQRGNPSSSQVPFFSPNSVPLQFLQYREAQVNQIVSPESPQVLIGSSPNFSFQSPTVLNMVNKLGTNQCDSETNDTFSVFRNGTSTPTTSIADVRDTTSVLNNTYMIFQPTSNTKTRSPTISVPDNNKNFGKTMEVGRTSENVSAIGIHSQTTSSMTAVKQMEKRGLCIFFNGRQNIDRLHLSVANHPGERGMCLGCLEDDELDRALYILDQMAQQWNEEGN
uniref:RING-type domain-containing protein n=1 Tax=Heterorhabditis bacteriophora TaxID=37862 RepID=A0A1I7XHR0_HETBA